MITETPLANVRAGSQTNKDRMFFVSRADAQKVLDACPDAEWRLIFALSRYGGLRCPSEHLALKWADVDWDKARVRVPNRFPSRPSARRSAIPRKSPGGTTCR